MRLSNTVYWILLSIFGFTLVFSVGLLFRLQGKSLTPTTLGSQNASGTYKIDASETVSVSSPYQVKFIANTDGKAVNAVSLYVAFDPEKLRILNVNTSDSFCQFYPENKFNNTAGTISISCGAPSPGFTGESVIAVVDFYTTNIGQASLTITDKSQILLNDGKGTNIFSTPIEHKLLILNGI